MALRRCYFLVFIFLYTFEDVYPLDVKNDSEDTIDKLLERIERLEFRLETSDAVNKVLISEMKAEHEREVTGLKLKVKEMEASFNEKVAVLENEIKGLKNGPLQQDKDQTEQLEHRKDDTEVLVEGHMRIRRQENIVRQYRDFPEQRVAFYATHTDGEIHNLGAQQILVFQQTHTNVGKAYNNNTGSFVAPVDGTYVFHATIMGIDTANLTHNHFHAHFDVDGVVYSKFVVTAYEQCSQMLVINLKSEQTVNVKNDRATSGFYGQHYSTFSGFLLYQNVPSGTIVGK